MKSPRRLTALAAAGSLWAMGPLLPAPAGAAINLNQVILGVGKLVKAAVPISVENEVLIGREVAATLIGRYGLRQDPELDRYLSLVGSVLVEQCSRPELPFHFAVLKTKEINAFEIGRAHV